MTRKTERCFITASVPFAERLDYKNEKEIFKHYHGGSNCILFTYVRLRIVSIHKYKFSSICRSVKSSINGSINSSINGSINSSICRSINCINGSVNCISSSKYSSINSFWRFSINFFDGRSDR